MIEAMKQWLEALEKNYKLINGEGTRFGLEGAMDGYYSGCFDVDGTNKETENAIASLRQAIAELESQEPYGWVSQHTTKGMYEWQFNKEIAGVYQDTAISILPVYTHPPQRTWVGLTEQEVWDAVRDTVGIMPSKAFRVYQAIEAELKQKNHVAQETNS